MSQTDHTDAATRTTPGHEVDFEDVTSYQDGDATVILDTHEPTAWVRSAVTVSVRR